ncbi:MAG TPA: flagellar protein FliJ [Desulfitobacteriaceae bacterium]|nr:flagellar protein FliJ [Desulfitobacteriaceae bacterium]
MPLFKFRLKTCLRLAEQKVDERKIQMAKEAAVLQERSISRDEQKKDWHKAMNGQREAGLNQPESLGMWSGFTFRQLNLLRQREEELVLQEEVVERRRSELIEAKRESEKLIRLREKQEIAFKLESDHREQLNLDEIAQDQYCRKLTIRTSDLERIKE